MAGAEPVEMELIVMKRVSTPPTAVAMMLFSMLCRASCGKPGLVKSALVAARVVVAVAMSM
eukprot:CAMPEP_0195052986 /NCGR_PEP_ID=MMETSP0448-20130528/2273_1 /TAXON_ID=66468 /ORGANISM="Heterocapsa triquestra, Strain CCMP 448" /LENGTH=60 /DNA_ID=CAMNT_0040082223 /DNA_START=1 /DNA_END=183 /DNA_ORIENTATION=+